MPSTRLPTLATRGGTDGGKTARIDYVASDLFSEHAVKATCVPLSIDLSINGCEDNRCVLVRYDAHALTLPATAGKEKRPERINKWRLSDERAVEIPWAHVEHQC